MGYVYSITNVVNGKLYIGQTTISRPNSRFSQHKYNLMRNIHQNSYLQRSWNKYGKDAFEFNVLFEIENELLNEMETKSIQVFDSLSPNGYNLSIGGEQTESSREMIARKWKENPDYKCTKYKGLISPEGVIFSPIKNLSRFSREHGLDPRSLRRVAVGDRYSHKGWISLSRDKFEFTEKVSQKLGKIQKENWKNRRKHCNGTIGVYDIKLISPSDEIFGPIVNLSKFSREHDLCQSSLSCVISGKRKSHRGWKLLTLENKI